MVRGSSSRSRLISPRSACGSKARLCGAMPNFLAGPCPCRLTQITAQQGGSLQFENSQRLAKGLRCSCREGPSLKQIWEHAQRVNIWSLKKKIKKQRGLASSPQQTLMKAPTECGLIAVKLSLHLCDISLCLYQIPLSGSAVMSAPPRCRL